MPDLDITVDDRRLTARWVDENEAVQSALGGVLPMEGDATRWGDELYVSVPVSASPAETGTRLRVGDVAYWPAGEALCLFWGPTPASDGDRPVAAAPVGVVARLDDVAPLDGLAGDAHVRVEAG